MTEVVGVRFKQAGQIYYFNRSGVELGVGDSIVVETSRGLTMGKVVVAPKDIDPNEIDEPLKPVIRQATPDDFKRVVEMNEKGSKALATCIELVAKFQLPMKPLAAEYTLDDSHLTIFFKSEKRVDFRTLLRELSAALKTRVELRQIGARDAAKLVGGMGRCGYTLCCASHLSKFETISMRMAREQDLPLNPTNISGICGRLLCCLAYENEQYREMKQELPATGQIVTTNAGEAKVIGCNPLKETVIVRFESDATTELPLSEIQQPGNNKSQ